MIATPPINRELLGPSGFDLSEDDYVRVVAALGAKSTFAPAASGAGQQSLRWSMGQFLDQRALPRISLDVSKIWPVWKDATDQQILIDADHIPLGSPDLIDVVRVLSHSAVGLASIAVDLFSPHAGDKWQWPLRVAALPDDFADLGVETLGGKWPSSSLAEVHELSREHIRAEVLLIRADLRDALQRILALPYPVRAGYCILLMPVDVKWDDVRSYLAALLAETQAGGASFVALPASQSVADILNKWIEELSHNLPFDRSLGAAFKVAPSIHILNSALIDRAALPTAATRLAPRLRQLPPDIKFTLPADISQARINWTAGRPLQVGGAFPAERLDWTKHDSHTLQVLFAEPRQWEEPLRGTLTLPYRGRSTSCQFVFTPTRTGPFAGRVVVLHRGRGPADRRARGQGVRFA